MKPAVFLLQAVLILFFSGCYTQFVVVDRSPPPETVEYRIDTLTGDTVKVIRQMDTIRTKDRETCVWERDLLGYPHLRCYNSYYPHDWFWYNNSPWWYRNDPYWHDYNRCPRYYYYDPSCGCCRYTGSSYYRNNYNDNPYRQGGSSNRSPSGAGSSVNPRTQGIEDAAHGSSTNTGSSQVSGTSGTAGGNRQSGTLVIPKESRQPFSIINGRTSGLPEVSGGAQPVPPGATSTPPKPVTATVNQQPAGTPPPPPPPPPSSDEQKNSENERRERQNPRSW